MKNIFLILSTLLLGNISNAQVAIGKPTVEGNNTLIDFVSGTTKGIILSSTTNDPSTAANGTFIYNTTDKKVKVKSNDEWLDLSDEGDSSATTNTIDATAVEVGNGVVIGKETSTKVGALVLESDDKALILPKIFRPDLNVKNPYPGMICFDTESNTLAVYDGTNWNYWK
ncbi:DUF2793 domain-containing protein [Faecalibacter bovis]|uniref:WG repeat-containing protein n=1 Tax=Faecalibacter bovis TaxID=2898187 RepID=A0ABX7XDB0_9FLAO|nr:DUF2793 domain-containing protein [Faecalibacter bovis]MBS7332476.1 hypothetical protein [Weeksellaceae bacterium]QTV05883.1 hypothetical protein J9309_00600 [Faecalibacter bovis]